MERFPHLSAPIQVCGKEIKNRIVLPPMADFGMTGPDGLVNERHIERYTAYSRGGTGLIIIEACAVTKMAETRGTIKLYDDDCLPGLGQLAEASKGNGAVSLVQLNISPQITQEESIVDMNRETFSTYKNQFISAAIRCQKAGFDGVELHAAHGMYLNQVIETSQRKDEYGGSFENRVRLLEELIQEIKVICGTGFIVAVRFGNPNLGELLQTAQAIEQAGGDLLDVSTGITGYRNIPDSFHLDSKIYAASLVKQQAHIPVICVGNITTGQQAEDVLIAGYSDMAAVGRGHLCDPDWAQKALAGEQPILCKRCRGCAWYSDGKKCPAVLKRRR